MKFLLSALILASSLLQITHQQSDPFTSLVRFIGEGQNQIDLEPPDQPRILKEYDFIIVGAGTAGCALANRLTEVPQWKVLLIEAGANENFIMDIPLIANYLQFTEANWKYKTMPSDRACLGFEGRQCNWPRGKVVGGSSVLNYMIYTRGNRRDFDNWAQLGNIGWNWDEVLPYFKKIENYGIPKFDDPYYHGKDGYLHIEHAPFRTEMAKAWVKGAQQAGHKYNDHNAATQTGVSFLQLSMKNGTRHSSSRAYLHPIKGRTNLHVVKLSMATKLIIDADTKTVRGVEFERKNRRYRVLVTKEVICTAGAINSAQLLMLSGIGPREHLESLNIPVVKDLKVGYNLMDHIAAGGLTFVVKTQNMSLSTRFILNRLDLVFEWMRKHGGPLSVPGGCEALTFIDLDNQTSSDGWADMELLFIGGSVNNDPLLKRNFGFTDEMFAKVYGPLGNKQAFMVFPMLMRPKSKGRILLKNKNPYSYPQLYSNYFAEEQDLQKVVRGIKAALKIAEQPAMKKMGTKLYTVPIPECLIKGEFGSDAYWACHAQQFTFTIYHLSGTCKMGPAGDPSAVVDPRLRVHGVRRLRVADASIMPEVTSGHTNAPVYLIAEKAADMIKQDWRVWAS